MKATLVIGLLAAAGFLSGCDPNPNGPSAPTAPALENRPVQAADAKKAGVSPLRQVGRPAD